MADIVNRTQFSDLPSCLAIDILLQLPLKTLLTCRYVRKDWTRLYFSDPYFIRRQLETSNIQFLNKDITNERKFRFGCFVDEVSTGNLRIETLDDFSCKYLPDPKHEWLVVNSCNGLVCLIDKPRGYGGSMDNSSVYVCNPILGEWVSIPVPDRCFCALGFSAKNNQYKILLCIEIGDFCPRKYEWEIYTLGTQYWRSIKTKENISPFCGGLSFNTFIHGSLHWTGVKGVLGFDFETETFTSFSLPEPQNAYIEHRSSRLGVINGRLWVSFYNFMQRDDGEMWAMKEYGDERSWTLMLAMGGEYSLCAYPISDELVMYEDRICSHDLLYTLNGEDMLTSHLSFGEVKCYNIKTPRRRALDDQCIGRVTAYNPSFVSLHDFRRGEQVIRGRDLYDGLIKKLADRAQEETKEEEREETKEEDQEEKEMIKKKKKTKKRRN